MRLPIHKVYNVRMNACDNTLGVCVCVCMRHLVPFTTFPKTTQLYTIWPQCRTKVIGLGGAESLPAKMTTEANSAWNCAQKSSCALILLPFLYSRLGESGRERDLVYVLLPS